MPKSVPHAPQDRHLERRWEPEPPKTYKNLCNIDVFTKSIKPLFGHLLVLFVSPGLRIGDPRATKTATKEPMGPHLGLISGLFSEFFCLWGQGLPRCRQDVKKRRAPPNHTFKLRCVTLGMFIVVETGIVIYL